MRQTTSSLVLDTARLTNAQWFAVSAFEAVIDLPARLAEDTPTGVLGPRSPARYHLIALGPTFASSALAVVYADRHRRPLLAAGLAANALAGGLTGVLVLTVNVPLLRGSVPRSERAGLIRRWHRVNRVRLLVLAAAGATYARAAQQQGITGQSGGPVKA